MAVSPLITHPGSANSATPAGKGKAMAVRSNANGSSHVEPTGNTEAEPELAEQLNEETKRRYVKGLVVLADRPSRIDI